MIPRSRPEVWAGVEASYLTVGGERRDQLAETGHATRVDDIERLAELGVDAVRYPIIWGRGGSETDWAWADTGMRAIGRAGIRAVVGLLHHGWGPESVDPLQPEYPSRLAAYALKVARRYPQARAFLPVNEPLTTARFSGLYGWWDPMARDERVFASLLVAQCLAIRAVSQALRRHDPTLRLIVNEDAGKTYGNPALQEVIDHYNDRRWLTFDLLTGRVQPGHPHWSYLRTHLGSDVALRMLADDPATPDVLGIDYYVTSDRYLAAAREEAGTALRARPAFDDIEFARVPGAVLDGLGARLREVWGRYRLPVALTEVHLGGSMTDEVAWWSEAWLDAVSVAADGIPVEAVTSWASFGSVGWDGLLRTPGGRYSAGAFDVSSGTAVRTRLGDAVAQSAAAATRLPESATGWWRRQEVPPPYLPDTPKRASDNAPAKKTRGWTEKVRLAPR